MPSPRDHAAFATLVEDHERAVLAYALRRAATSADAEDAAAETWATAWRRRDALPDDPLPWLYATARRVLANQHRGGRRRTALLERLRGHGRSSSGGVLLGEPRSAVTEALERLRPGDAELLRLVAWEELGHARIAASLGISVNAVAIRLHRARARFATAYAAVEREHRDREPATVEAIPTSELKGPGSDRTHGTMKATLAPRAQEVDR